jgi:hypothetical protein
MSNIFTSSSYFRNNALIIIDGLKTSESQSGIWLRNELLDLQHSISLPIIERHSISSSHECRELLKRIAFRCTREGMLPILHFEAHGNKEVIAFPSDSMHWSEMMENLREINESACGNLGVVMSTCNGFYALTPLDIKRATPFFFLMGSQEVLLVDQIKRNMFAFYKELFLNGDLNTAMIKVEKEFKQYNSEHFFAVVLGRIFRQHFVGHSPDKRIKAALSTIAYDRMKRKNRRGVYWAAKSFNRATQKKFGNYADVFFPYGHGLSCRCMLSFLWENYRAKHSYAKPKRLPPKVAKNS